jgi:hypothetical protein
MRSFSTRRASKARRAARRRVAGAARSEPALAELLTRLHADRAKNLRVLVDALAANGPLGLDATGAVETVRA